MKIRNFIVLISMAITFNAVAQEWIQMFPSTPPPERYNSAAAYDLESDRIVIFGGYRTGEWFNDLWEYDLNRDTCIQRSPLPDYGRVGPRMVYDSSNDKIILFGGYTAILGYLNPNHTWEYDLNTDTWTNKFPSSPPMGRSSTAMAYDSESEKIVMFGGFNFEDLPLFLNDTWVYDLSANTWTEMHPDTSPSTRQGHMMVYDSQSDRIVLFGGENASRSLLKDTWEYDLNTNTWTEKSPIDSVPWIGYRAGMAYDSRRDKTVLFSRNANYPSPEPQTWEYDLDTDTWIQILVSSSPSIRSRPGMAYDSESERVVLFGGLGGTNYYNDIWVYEPLIGVEEENQMPDIGCQMPRLEVYPNPFRDKTKISYGVTEFESYGVDSKTVSLRIYDASGRVVKTFGDILCNLNNSVQSVSWDGRDMKNREVRNGVYFLKIEGCEVMKVIKLK